MATIEELHRELNYDAYAGELHKNPSLLRTLKGLQTRARREPGLLSRYRQLLSQSIAHIEAANAASPEQIVAEARSFWSFYSDKAKELDIASYEANRLPHSHQAWVEKNLPRTWARFEKAVAQTVETGGTRAYDALRQVSVEMLTAYIEGRE